MKEEEVPILYAYIFRNIRTKYRCNVIIPIEELIPLMRKVVHTCPRLIHKEIIFEMEEMGLIKMYGKDKCILLNNKCEQKCKEYAFPVHP
jgi:hypothetical protein